MHNEVVNLFILKIYIAVSRSKSCDKMTCLPKRTKKYLFQQDFPKYIATQNG